MKQIDRIDNQEINVLLPRDEYSVAVFRSTPMSALPRIVAAELEMPGHRPDTETSLWQAQPASSLLPNGHI